MYSHIPSETKYLVLPYYWLTKVNTMKDLQRELRRGTLELLLLKLLAEEPTYGYELVSKLAHRSAGRFEIKEGTLYPVLYRLEDAGLIVPEWDQPARGVPRKVYRLTGEGTERVEELTNAWRTYAADVEAILAGEKPAETQSEDRAEEET